MKKLLVLFAAVFLSVSAAGKTVVLYHTSDVHGFFYPQKGVGGYAALSALLKQEKNPYLLLDSGDFASGTAETKETKGLAAVELMNALGYDAATVGNHEFDFGDTAVAPLLKKATFAVLAANLREKKTDKLPVWARAYQVFDAGGTKVAVIGLANRHPTQPTTLYYFTKPLDALGAALAQSERESPAFTVVLVHDSLADYKSGAQPYVGKIALKYGGRVQIVLGGHAHKIFQNEFINGVLYAESGAQLKGVTKITVELDDTTGQVTKAASEFIALEVAQTGSDAQIAALADSYRNAELEEVIGTAGADLPRFAVVPGEKDSPLDDWVSDVGRAYAQTDVFIHNTSGTRVALEKGPITRRMLVALFPFDDEVVKLQVPGRVLKNFIRRGLAPRNKYAYSGLEISYALNKKGEVKDLQVLLAGQPVENERRYTVATNSYVAKHSAFAAWQAETVGEQSVREMIAQAFEKGPVFPPKTGRIIQK